MTEYDRYLDDGMEDYYGGNDSAYLEEDDMDDEIDEYLERKIQEECWYEDHPESGYQDRDQ